VERDGRSRHPFDRFPVLAVRIEQGQHVEERFYVSEVDLPNDELGPLTPPPPRSEGEARGESTGGVEWDIEMVNPGGLQRRGVEIDTLKVGDRLTTSVWVAKNGRREAFTHAMTLARRNAVVFPIDQLTCPY
jgi:hypothetical protein